jgi:hypothetical protein
MKPCFHCARPGFATLNIDVMIGATRLKMSEHAEQPAVCAVCLLALAEWFKSVEITAEKLPVSRGTVST